MEFIKVRFKRFFKKFFPKIYYSEKVQKFLFELMLPSPVKFIVLILAILIFVLIWNGFSTDNVTRRITGYNSENEIIK